MASSPVEFEGNFTLDHNETWNETWNTTVTPNPYPTGLQFFIIWTIPILIVLLNTIVFIIIPRITALQPGTSVGMLSLAVSDFSMGTFIIVNNIYVLAFTHYQVEQTHWVCVMVAQAISINFGTSMMALTFLAVDRLMKMTLPLKYPRIMTRRNTRIIVVIIWIVIVAQIFLDFKPGPDSETQYYKHVFVCINRWTHDVTYNLLFAFFAVIFPACAILVSFIGIICIATRRKVQPGQASQVTRDFRIFKTLCIMTLGLSCFRIPIIIV